jgi:hypothetical protein
MHVLSELRNPLFDSPNRRRALQALQMSRLLKENTNTKAWSVVRSMIDKVLGEQFENQSQGPIYPTQIPSYILEQQRPQRRQPQMYMEQPVSSVQSVIPMSQEQQIHQPQFNWDDINLNTIVSDIPLTTNQEIPEYDWVSRRMGSQFGLRLTD